MIDPELIEDAPSVNPRMLRHFAAVWLVLFSGLSWWSWRRGEIGEARMFAALAFAAGPLGLVRPEAIRPLFETLSALTRPIGALMTRLILVVLFYCLFAPLALFFKTIGRDALNRRRRPQPDTYWTRRTVTANARRYFQQY